MNEVIVKWFDGTTNLVKFTDLIPCKSLFGGEWIHETGSNTKWLGTVKKIFDEENIEIEWDLGGVNRISSSDIRLVELELFSGQVTWKYDKKWTGEIQFSEKRKRFNPKTHCRFLHNENNRYDGDPESDGADSDGSQPDLESESDSSENEIEKNQGSAEEPAPRWRS